MGFKSGCFDHISLFATGPNFVHTNTYHLMITLLGLFLLANYERRVGSRRYLMIFFLSALSSSIILLPFAEEFKTTIATIGPSAAILGIMAANFIDYKNLSKKDLVYSILIFALFALVYNFACLDCIIYGEYERSSPYFDLNMFYFNMLCGALSGMFLCKLFPVSDCGEEAGRYRKAWGS